MTGYEFSTWMVVPLALPLVILVIREPLHNVLHHHGVFAGGVIGVFLECCIGVMETLTGYFSSTVSFVRRLLWRSSRLTTIRRTIKKANTRINSVLKGLIIQNDSFGIFHTP